MINAKLMKSLEEEGFLLEIPDYESNEQRIIDLLKENNDRLLLALPLLLQYDFSYKKVINNLNKKQIKDLNTSIAIAYSLLEKENIEHSHLKKIIRGYALPKNISRGEFSYYHTSFKNALRKREEKEEKDLTVQIDFRGKLNLNKALSTIYSPGKKRIMEKIFNHDILTDTELKYYYRSIRPLILAILNETLQKYLRIIESTKKYS